MLWFDWSLDTTFDLWNLNKANELEEERESCAAMAPTTGGLAQVQHGCGLLSRTRTRVSGVVLSNDPGLFVGARVRGGTPMALMH